MYVDKLAAVAATTASDLEELSTGMSRVASAAASMGVDVDQLNAQLATIVSVTRQAPESVGTALRSIYARMGQLQVDGEDEFGVTLGKYTEQMQQMGIEILDQEGNMREMGDVIEEVARKWNGWTQAQRNAAAQAMAGTRQYNNLVALFDNWDMYTEALETSQNAMGTLQDQQDIYMESTAAHLQQLQTEFERTFEILLDSDAINTFSDGLEFVLEHFNKFLSSVGGGMDVFTLFGSLVTNVFSDQIGKSIEDAIVNFQTFKANVNSVKLKQDIIDAHAIKGEDITSSSAVELEAAYAQKILDVRKALTAEEYNGLTSLQERIGLLENEIQLNSQKVDFEVSQMEEGKKLEQFYEERTAAAQEELRVQEQITEDFKAKNTALQESFNDYKMMQDSMQGMSAQARAQVSIEEQRRALLEALSTIQQESLRVGSSITLNSTQRAIIQDAINKLSAGEAINLKVVQGIVANINSQYGDQVGKVETINELLAQMREQQLLGQSINNDTDLKAQQLAISGVIKGFSALGMSIMNVRSVIRTLTDDTLSLGDKAINIIMTLSMMLPTLISTFRSVATAIQASSVSMLAFGGAVAGIAAVIGIVVTAISALVKAANAESIALENANKIAQDLNRQYDDTKTAYDNLKETLSDYTEAEEALSKLTKGTQEWQEAVDDLNEKVLNLLETYPELADKITNNNGVLSITDEGQDLILENQKNKTQTAYRASLAGQVNKNNVLNENNKSDLENVLNRRVLDDVFEALEENGLSALQNTDTLSDAIENNTYTLAELEEILSHREEITDVYNQMQQRDSESKIYLQKIGDSFVQALDANNQYSQQTAILVGQKTEEAFTAAMDKWEDKGKGGGGITDKKAQEEYAKYMGYESSKDKGDNKGEYLINGEWVEIADSTARAALAWRDAQEEITSTGFQEAADAIKNFVDLVDSDNENVKKAMANFANRVGDLSELTQNDINELKNLDISKMDNAVLSNVSFDQKSFKNFRDNVVKAWDTNVASITEDMNKDVQDAFNKIDTSNLTLDEKQNVADIFELADAYGKLDEAINAYNAGTLEEFAKGIKEVTDSLSTFSQFSSQYAEMNKEIDKLKDRGSISSEIYDALNENLQSYFQPMLDGTYQLIDSAEHFKNAYDTGQLEAADRIFANIRKEYERLSEIKNYDFDALTQPSGKLVQGPFADPFENANQKLDQRNFLQQQVNVVDVLGGEDMQDQVGEWQNMLDTDSWPQTSKFFNELADAVENCRPRFESLDEEMKPLKEDMDSFDAGIQSMTRQLDEDLDPGKVQQLSDYLYDVRDSASDLGKELADDLTPESADALSEAIYRYNDGIEDAIDHVEEWNEALNSDAAQYQVDVMDELRDAYADLLDVSGNSFSPEFLTDINNLELMKAAIDGDTEAYNQLAAAANQDIVAHLELSEDDQIAFNNALANVEHEIQRINLEDIEVGAYIDDVDFLNSLTEMINAAHMTRDVATDYLMGMGIDAEVVSGTETRQDTNTMTGWTSTFVPAGGDSSYSIPKLIDDKGTVENQTGQYVARSLHVTPDPATTVDTKQGTGFALEVRNARKAAGGDIKFKHSAHGGGGAGGSKGKSGGGKGGGGSAKKPTKMDKKTDKADRYHDVNIQLSKIANNYDKLAKAEEKLTGKKLLNNLNEQLKILEKQKKTLQEKQKIQAAERAELQKELAKSGVKFDKEGYTTNYTQQYEKRVKKINDMINKYNKMAEGDKKEKYKETIEEEEKTFDKWKETLERYEELKTQDIPDLASEIQDTIDKEVELKVRKFNYKIEVRMDFEEALRDYYDFKEEVDKDFFEPKNKAGKNLYQDRNGTIANANRLYKEYQSYLNDGLKSGSIQADTYHINRIITEINKINKGKNSSIYGKDKNQALEDLKESSERLMENLQNIQELSEDVHEDYLDIIDEASDAFDAQVDTYEIINEMLEHDMNVMELIYGEEAYARMSDYYDQMKKNNNEELSFLRLRAEYTKQMYDKETDPEAKEEWKEQWLDAQQEVNDKFEEQLELILDEYTNAVELAFQELNNRLSNGMGLDFLEDEWDLMEREADQWLDPVNAMYGLNQLQSKYQDAIDNTDSVHNQKILNDLMESELSMLREKDHLSQYDLDRANKKYEIALKQLAVEEEQNNKSKLRLRRDSQGNYSYQFVEDEDEIEKLKDELSTLQNELYNLDLDKYKDNLDTIYEYNKDLQEAIKDLELETQRKIQEIRNDSTLTDEERALKEQEIREEGSEKERQIVERYEGLINGLVEDNAGIRKNLLESAVDALKNGPYKDNEEAFKSMTGTNLEEFLNMDESMKEDFLNVLVPAWNSGLQAMVDEITKAGGVKETYLTTFEQLGEATKKYQESVSEAAKFAGEDLKKLSKGYDKNEKAIESLIEDNATLIGKYSTEVEAIQQVIKQLDALETKYGKVKDAALAAVDAALKLQQQETVQVTGGTTQTTGGSASGGNANQNQLGFKRQKNVTGTLGDSVFEKAKDTLPQPSLSEHNASKDEVIDSIIKDFKGKSKRTRQEKIGVAIATLLGTYGWNDNRLTKKGFYPQEIYAIANLLASDVQSGMWLGQASYMGIPKGQIANYAYSAFKTGGYTGEWGEGGKLAILHEKELILNKQDTQNILNAVNLVRDMNGVLASLSDSTNGRIAGLLGGFQAKSFFGSKNNDTIEQSVHITAEFPGVRDSKEIENAFNNLINRASQYAFRRSF